jgi:hypothetical protein
MELLGRSPELGRLRHALDQRRASLVRVSGMRGVGKSALVAHCIGDYDHAVMHARPFPDLAIRAQLRDVLGRTAALSTMSTGSPRRGRGTAFPSRGCSRRRARSLVPYTSCSSDRARGCRRKTSSID